MNRPPVADGHGRLWVFGRVTSAHPRDASRLTAVLIDLAYSQQSSVVEAGRRMLMRETAMTDVRAFTRAVKWLVERGLLVVTSDDPRTRGQAARSFYDLTVPPEIVDQVPLLREAALDGRVLSPPKERSR